MRKFTIKKTTMKRARRKVLAGLLLCGTIAGVSTSMASTSHDMSIKGLNAKMHGYIDFLEGPLWIADKVYYNGSVSGKEAYLITSNSGGYVQAGTNKKDLKKKYVYYGNAVSVSGANCGYGGSYAYLNMSCEGSKTRIRS